MSRLKKKLLLYFLLIAIVSISVSSEIILEISSKKLGTDIISNFYSQIGKYTTKKDLHEIKEKIESDAIFEPIYKLRNRMILFLLFISASIIAAFILFTKDIVSPMDSIVDATKKIVRGDLTVDVPVMTEDEIGLIASLINNMNKNLTDMINQVRHELNKYKFTLIDVHNIISQIMLNKKNDKIIEQKIMRLSEFKKMLNLGKSVIKTLTSIIDDLSELQSFLSMYKTYSIESELTQKEIDEAVTGFKTNSISPNRILPQ